MNPQPTLYSSQAGAGSLAGMMGAIWLLDLVLLALGILALWMIFRKAGEAGWQAIIPIWNTIVLLKIVGRPWWWILLLLIPIVNIVILIIVLHDLSMSFGHGWGFTIGLIFLSLIFYLILAFNSDKYIGPGGKAMAAPAAAPAPYQPPAPPAAPMS